MKSHSFLVNVIAGKQYVKLFITLELVAIKVSSGRRCPVDINDAQVSAIDLNLCTAALLLPSGAKMAPNVSFPTSTSNCCRTCRIPSWFLTEN